MFLHRTVRSWSTSIAKRESGLTHSRNILGVAASTLSATIARLEKLGYLSNTPAANDKRQRELRLTARGAEAIAATSVLNADRVNALMRKLTRDERKAALKGLALLARAAREIGDTP